MAKRKIEDIVRELALPITKNHSFELVDIEFLKEGTHWYLRVYIDKPDGITIDDCQVVSEELDEKLNGLDLVEQSYFLEVSSPGLERPLKNESDFEKYKGKSVEVKLFQPVEGKKIFEGELQGLVNNVISIKNSLNVIMEFKREEVALIKRIVRF